MAVPRSAFPVPRLDPVSNCHTLANPLDCPVKYAATIAPADLRDPRGPDGRADGPTVRTARARVALEEMAASAREMLAHMDTTRLAPAERAALRLHLAQLSNSVSLVRRAETYLRYYAGGFALVVIVFGALALTVAVRLARHLSRPLSRPIDELVGGARLICPRLPPPRGGAAARGAPPVEAPRPAPRALATA